MTTTTTTTETSPFTQEAPALTAVQHIGLTVGDVAVSEGWYTEVLGLVRAFVDPHPNDDGYAVVMTRPGTALFIGLHHHPHAGREAFSPQRTGLDHLAIQVPNRDAIDAWVNHLDAIGADHEAVVERSEPVPFALVLVRDPDGIAIELFWFGG